MQSPRRLRIGPNVAAKAVPTPEVAPVVVFNHGWFAVNPGVYGAWIEHMVRKGRIVIAPRYQRDWSTRERELRALMNKAEQDTGGAVVNVLAYKADHVAAHDLPVAPEHFATRRRHGGPESRR